jgi:hypothetical protein
MIALLPVVGMHRVLLAVAYACPDHQDYSSGLQSLRHYEVMATWQQENLPLKTINSVRVSTVEQ